MSQIIPTIPPGTSGTDLVTALNDRIRRINMALSTSSAGGFDVADAAGGGSSLVDANRVVRVGAKGKVAESSYLVSDVVLGAPNLTHTGVIPKVSGAGTVTESALTDDGTYIYTASRDVGVNTPSPAGVFHVYYPGVAPGYGSNQYPVASVTTTDSGYFGGDNNCGVKFTVNANGRITELRIRIATTNTCTVRLYDMGGSVLASASITGIVNSWVSSSITPVTVTAGSSYVVSVRSSTSIYQNPTPTPFPFSIASGDITLVQSRYQDSVDTIPLNSETAYIFRCADVTFQKTSGGSPSGDGLVIPHTGNVGVMMASPSYPLDVVGEVNTSTAYRVGGLLMTAKNLVCASIAATNLSAAYASANLQVNGGIAPAGMYRVSVYIATRTAGSGIATLVIGWTDGIGAKTIGPGMNLTAGNSSVVTIPLHSSGVANITLSVTYSATGAYDLYADLEQLR